jgi:hypothetical protein
METLIDLKARAYDLISIIQYHQNLLNDINLKISNFKSIEIKENSKNANDK